MPTIGGYVLALGVAVAAILFDCYKTLEKNLPRVPGFIAWHPAIRALSAAGGATAAVAYGLVDPKSTDVISTAISLKAHDPTLRGAAVGATVLLLLRSKLFNFGDSGFGGELVYTLGRTLALQAVNNEHTRRRDRYLDSKKSAAFAMPNYFPRLEAQMTGASRTLTPDNQQRLADEINTIKAASPAPPIVANSPAWDAYYRSMTGVCYDYCGPTILKEFPGFA